MNIQVCVSRWQRWRNPHVWTSSF